MNIGNRLKRFGIEQTFKFVYKDPEPNLRKLMDWADGLSKGTLPSQRKAIREAIENQDHPFHEYILHMWQHWFRTSSSMPISLRAPYRMN